MLRVTNTACMRPSTHSRGSLKVTAIASHANHHQSSSNGVGPHRLQAVQATLEDINKALASCIKEAASMSSLEKINKGIGKEISKAAEKRSGN